MAMVTTAPSLSQKRGGVCKDIDHHPFPLPEYEGYTYHRATRWVIGVWGGAKTIEQLITIATHTAFPPDFLENRFCL